MFKQALNTALLYGAVNVVVAILKIPNDMSVYLQWFSVKVYDK